mmetsp:Transcript_37474/g.82167  ORF Transcript_37474/g.82167 Transcript_37474/m.82167 type:complete len:262 (+) Transcript_37474:626-1411(+)
MLRVVSTIWLSSSDRTFYQEFGRLPCLVRQHRWKAVLVAIADLRTTLPPMSISNWVISARRALSPVRPSVHGGSYTAASVAVIWPLRLPACNTDLLRLAVLVMTMTLPPLWQPLLRHWPNSRAAKSQFGQQLPHLVAALRVFFLPSHLPLLMSSLNFVMVPVMPLPRVMKKHHTELLVYLSYVLDNLAQELVVEAALMLQAAAVRVLPPPLLKITCTRPCGARSSSRATMHALPPFPTLAHRFDIGDRRTLRKEMILMVVA